MYIAIKNVSFSVLLLKEWKTALFKLQVGMCLIEPDPSS